MFWKEKVVYLVSIQIQSDCNRKKVSICNKTLHLKGSAEVVRLLLERGANMEHVDLNGLRPLDRGIEFGNIPAIQVFLKKGAKLGPTTWSMSSSKPDIM